MLTSSIFEATRLGLARISLENAGELRRAIERATSASAKALGVARVGVWFLTPNGDELALGSLYELATDTHSEAGTTRLKATAPYLASLESRRVLALDDISRALEIAAFRDSYLAPLGITSTMDAAVFRLGEIVAVVRLEHIGLAREWTARERDFAASVADLLAVMLEQATRLDVEAAMRAQGERLAKAEKLESLSRLSGGVAHDFNNVLAAMLLALEAIKRTRKNDEALLKAIDGVLATGDRGTRIVRQLLAFCREGAREARPIDVSRSLTEMTPLLTSLLGGACTLHVDVPKERLVATMDPAQLDQVVMNLVINARDAMASGGDVRIALSPAEDWVSLAVSDQGVGIADDGRDKIFEPFYTTKGHGTGLGLATVQSIVHQSGGTIDVASKLGEGTTFTVLLPRTG